MPQSPVSLEEFREHLNLDDGDTVSDAELWQCLLSAVATVEREVGALRLRQVSERVVSDVPHSTWSPVAVTEWPVFGDLAVSGGDVPNDFAFEPVRYGRNAYDVTYTVGRDPIPEDLLLAVKLVAALQWETQRGPDAASRFSAIGGEAGSSGGLAWFRAQQLMAPYRVPAMA